MMGLKPGGGSRQYTMECGGGFDSRERAGIHNKRENVHSMSPLAQRLRLQAGKPNSRQMHLHILGVSGC